MMRLLIILIGLCLVPMAPAATRYVWTNSPGTNNNDYLTWDTAATNIPEAVGVTVNGDVVLVTNGVYYASSVSTVATYTAMITVTNGITIQSVNGPAVTIVDGNYPGWTNRCFYISNASAVVSGFTITNGHAEAASPNHQGGGVYLKTSGTVTNCWILGNSTSNAPSAGYGGGVYMNYGGVLWNCTIAGNTATNYAGGVYNYKGLMQDCVISNNLVIGSGARGGGLELNAGTAVWCTITENIASNWATAGAAGGGVRMDGGTLTNCTVYNNATIVSGAGSAYDLHGGGISMGAGLVSKCSISSNRTSGDYGGGIAIRGTLSGSIVQDCEISSNAAGAGGGGIYIIDGGSVRNCLIRNNYGFNHGGISLGYGPATQTQRVENCTIVSNKATRSGAFPGGVDIETLANVQIVNSIIYSNKSADTVNYDNWKTNASSVSFSNCCTTPTNSASGVLPGAGNITNYPKFMNVIADNYRLTNNSPCVNRGTNQDWMTSGNDLDGRARIRERTVDMGAYEFLPRGTIISIP